MSVTSSTKLPVIGDGRNLVSPVSLPKTPSVVEQAYGWAHELRSRIDLQLKTVNEDGEVEVSADDVTLLKNELMSLIVTALQKDDRRSWCMLREAMLLCLPYSDYFTGQRETNHYIERLVHHLDMHKERLFDVQVMEALEKLFPKELRFVQMSGVRPLKNYCPPAPPRSLPPTSPRKPVPRYKFVLPDGKEPFKLEQKGDMANQKPKALTIGDLRQSIPTVALEAATREAIWTACLGNTTQALLCDLPDMPEEDRGEVQSRTSSQQSDDKAEEESMGEEYEDVSEEAQEVGAVMLDGRDAVAHFSKCYHTGKIKFMYFNIVPSVRYMPYNLTQVAKNKANPEHYVFSTFGVLHVYPDQPSENQSLAEWQKEAVLFKAVLAIPFFKHYLIRKMFTRWKENVHFSDFARVRTTVSGQVIQAVPSFGAALLQCSKLCQELLYLRFLPQDITKCYELGQFENAVHYMRLQAEKVLSRFFHYNKSIVVSTSEESFKKLKHCEEQVRHKTVFSTESLYLQRKKKEHREHNLKLAKIETAQLSNFVKLVDQLLLAHLVKLAVHSVTDFVHKTMESGALAPRDGFFRAKLVFSDEEGCLTISPRRDRFQQALSKTLNGIPVMLCQEAEVLEGSMMIRRPCPEDIADIPITPVSQSHLKSAISSISSPAKTPILKDALRSRGSKRSQVTFHPASADPKTVSEVTEKELNFDTETILTSPDLAKQPTPSKSKDSLGVATPDMVEVTAPPKQGYVLKDMGFVGQYKPLSKGNLHEKLINDDAYKEALDVQQRLMNDAMEEINEYCSKSAWLNEIFKFCNGWNDQSVLQWRGASGFLIEQKLNEIRQWTEKVRQFDANYVTDNGILYVDCEGVQQYVVPKLNEIYEALCAFVMDESMSLAKAFCAEMKEVLANMRNKETSIGGFADYARNVTKYKKNQRTYQERMEYIKALFEVVRMSYRQLDESEEKLEENVMTMWDAFLVVVQDAIDFVNVQTPLIIQNIEDLFYKLEEQARELSHEATTGRFLDPDQKPTTMLIEMGKLRQQYYSVQNQMVQASKWRESITQEPYDLKSLRIMASHMDIRQELWMYVEVSTHAIKEWKGLLFKKLNARKSLDKIQEWQSAAGQMKPHLPTGDAVLAFWYKYLSEFKKDLPLLHKLSNDALKPRHWKTIFLSMGESHDPNKQFTVEELLSYNLGAHADIINTVYAAAVSEFAIEQKLVKIRKMWVEREFKLAKHIPESIYKENRGPGARAKTPQTNRRTSKKFDKRLSVDKDPQTSKGKGLELYAEHLYVLIEVEELKYWLEDSRVTLQAMLQSPFLADHRIEAEYWYEALAGIEEIIDLWVVCQSKWLYLLKVFDEPEMFKKLEPQAKKFQELHVNLVEYMQAVTSDPRVVSMLNKQRGDRAWRLHQGDKLRELLAQWITTEEEILLHLTGVLNRARNQFPRLYFLSDQEIVELLALSRNPRALQPFARKCFSGVARLVYDLPAGTSSMNSALDYALNADKLEVIKIEGLMGEELSLLTRLKAIPQATKWLSTLEKFMKSTMLTIMEACIEARLEEGSGQPIKVLEELAKYEKMKSKDETSTHDIMAEITHRFSHWILRFPAQCVLTAEECMWERLVFRALEKQDMDELKLQKHMLNVRMEQYIKVLRENCLTFMSSDMRRRLHYMLGNLVNQAMYHRDVMDRLLANSKLSDSAYDWMRVLKYHMEIRTVLQAKAEGAADFRDDMAISSLPPQSDGEKERRTSVVKPVTQHRGLDDLTLTRAATAVTTGHQFGQCVISQMGATFAYDHEYLGPQPRLVFTPLTERAFLSLAIAMKSFSCGTLIGPQGTGKSETVRDLACAMGRHIVSINCNEDMTLVKMNQYLVGSIHAGSWALFDDTDRMTKGLMSVFAQQIEYLSNALRVLDSSSDNQYGIRGQPRFDKKIASKAGEKKIRRNSLTTLHSLPITQSDIPPPQVGVVRQTTVPHGFNEQGLFTYFEEPWQKERERRHSIEKEIEIKESELYKNSRPPPLFYEHVTRHRQPKRDFGDLVIDYVPFKPRYIGSVLFNGKLVKANANYGCFMTLSSTRDHSHIPDNIRLCMRPVALIVPDYKAIIEATLFMNGYQKHKPLAAKLHVFFDMVKTQLPRSEQYNFGLQLLRGIMSQACNQLHAFMNHSHKIFTSRQKRSTSTLDIKEVLTAPELAECEESSLIEAIKKRLLPRMASAEDQMRLRNMIRDVFPSSARPKSGIQAYPPLLTQTIREQMKHNNLQASDAFVLKVLQLYSALQLRPGVLLTGVSGTGKTTMYKLLSEVLTKLHSKDSEEKVDDGDLKTTHTMVFQAQQKLKMEDEDAEDEILKDAELEEDDGKKQGKQLWGKFKKLSQFGIMLQTMLDEEEEPPFPKVDLDIVYPNAFTPQELFGRFEQNLWQNGLLTKLLRNTNYRVEAAKTCKETFDDKKNKLQLELPSVIESWLILDGSLNPAWVDNMSTLLDSEGRLSLANGEQVDLQSESRIIFELTDLTNASPGAVARCSLVHCSDNTVHWMALFDSWSSLAKQRWVINTLSMQVLTSLVSSTFQTTLNFLSMEGMSSASYNVSQRTIASNRVAQGMAEVSNFLSLLSAMFDRHFLREELERQMAEEHGEKSASPEPQVKGKAGGSSSDSREGTANSQNKAITSASSNKRSQTSAGFKLEDLIPNYMSQVRNMFAFAYIWGFGGTLHESCLQRFDEFARETLRRAAQSIYLPPEVSVYDYYVDSKTGLFQKWSDKPLERSRTTQYYQNIPRSRSFPCLKQGVDRYCFMADLLISSHRPLLLMGDPGVGKSSLIENLVSGKHQFTKVVMSSGMTSRRLQHALMTRLQDIKQSRVEQMSQGPKVKPEVETHLFFIEDFNMASSDGVTGTLPALEVVRQILSERKIYDRQRKVLVDMDECDFIAAATHPGCLGSGHGLACHSLPVRLTRLFTTLTMFAPGVDMLHSIYTVTMQRWLEEFPTKAVQHHAEFAKAIVKGLIDLYVQVREKLRPTPTHAHYVFTLHELARVIQGMLLMSPRSKIKPKKKGRNDMVSRQSDFTSRATTALSSIVPDSGQQSALPPSHGGPSGRSTAVGRSGAPSAAAHSGMQSQPPPASVGSVGAGSLRPDSSEKKESLPPMMRVIARLWCHECSRVFGDRIINEEDKQWFEMLMEDLVINNFCSGAPEWQEKMSTIPEAISPHRTGTPNENKLQRENAATPAFNLLRREGLTPSPTSQSGAETGDEDVIRDSQSETATSAPLSPGLLSSKENTMASAEQLATPRSDGEGMQESAADGQSTALTTPGVAPSAAEAETDAETERDDDDADDDDDDSSSSEDSSADSSSDDDSGSDTRPSTSGSKEPADSGEEKAGAATQEPAQGATNSATEAGSSDGKASSLEQSRLNTQGSTTSEPVYTSESTSDVFDTRRSSSAAVLDVKRQTPSSGSKKEQGVIKKTKSKTGPKGGKGAAGGPRRGVTFKAGLIADKVVEKYLGPLMSLEQVKDVGEKVTDFMFTKYIMSSYAEAYGTTAEKGYVESHEDMLMEALYTVCSTYNKVNHQKIDPVFFREAVHHAARISRVMATPGGHALLLGVSYCTGRGTLVRLAAHYCNAKLYEPKIQLGGARNREIFHEHLKRLSKSAAYHGKSVVLLVHEDMGDSCLEDVCAFIKQGTCPGLYTDEEIQNIATQMNPGQVKTTRVDKIEAMFDKFTKRVKQNLHVVTCLNYSAGATFSNYTTLHMKLSHFPGLLTSACQVDLYQQWSHEAFVTIADFWLRDPTEQIPVPWSEHSRHEQISSVATAMAYIHSSAKAAVEKLYSHQRVQYKFFTPLTYQEFVHIFKTVAAFISKRERDSIRRYQSGLERMEEAFESIAQYKKEVADLLPKKRSAIALVSDHVQNVEQQRLEYIEALERCKEVEKRIEAMLTPLETLRHDAQAEFDKVNPTYYAALQALGSLKPSDFTEVKNYHCPPRGVTIVMQAVCLLFGEEQTWEAAKQLLLRENFFSELEFYKKDSIPKPVFDKLRLFIEDSDFQVDVVKKSSAAAAGLCSWVHAVFWYSEISRKMKPKISELLQAEDDLNRAQALLGNKRVEANRIKTALEAEIKCYKDAIAKQKAIEKQIATIERRISKANHLMDNMTLQHDHWRTELKQAKNKMKTAPGDALLTAACVCYHGPLDNRTRADLMNDWLNRCELGNFDPSLRLGKQVKPVSLSAKLESLMKPANMSGTESVHSIQHADSYQAPDAFSNKDDTSVHEGEMDRERPMSAQSQMSVYKHQPSIYDTSITFKTELRTQEQIEGLQHADLESIDTNSISSRNLLSVRDNFTLQDVLSTFEELSEWKLGSLPTDVHSLHNALIMRVCCHNRKHCWPLLIDPDNQAQMWVQALQDSDNIIHDDDIVRGQRGMEDHRALSVISDASGQSTEFDDTRSLGVSTTISTYTSRANTRQSTVRGNFTRISNLSSEDNRAVTSIAFASEAVGAKIDDSIDRPENNLWIISADDHDLDNCLLNAIVHGMTVLVTHVERKTLDPLFRALLLKQFTVDEKGQKTIRVGEMEYAYHPDFCLYLSTQSPLFLRGDGMVELPTEQTCVIDMSISQEGVIDRLLHGVMEVERPEFEGQRKSILGDLLHHQHELNKEHELVLTKTLQLSVPLLAEKTMLEALQHCQRNVQRNQMILEETQYLREHLEDKRAPYIPVATHGAKFFEIVQRCSVLNPLYHMPFETFEKLYRKTVHSRNRGKGSTGHLKARAQEFINATASDIYRYISSMMFEAHVQLFCLLLALERLRMSQQLTNQELGLFVNGVDTSEIEDNIVFDDKPDWVTNKVWLDCAALETTLSCFKGLRDSFKKYSTHWQEYFRCPVVLVNPLPGERLSSITVFQKCLLWRICNQQKMLEVSEALVVYELGGIISPPPNFNVKDVYEITDKSVPVVCVLPAAMTEEPGPAHLDSIKAHPFSTPVYEILQFAKETGMEGRVHVVTCGVSAQTQEIVHALGDCMQAGYWLVIQNAHLADPWDPQMLAILKKIMAAKPVEVDEEEEVVEENASAYTKTNTSEDDIHPDFRLWITARSDEGRLIPGMMIQHGLKVTCEMTSNFTSTLHKSYITAEKLFHRRDRAATAVRELFGEKSSYLAPMAVLHALLLHRRNFGSAAFAKDIFWSHVDLSAAIEKFRLIMLLCRRFKGVADISELIYGGHCDDIQDGRIVSALTEALLLAPKELAKLTEEAPGVAGLMAQVMPQPGLSFKNRLAELIDVSAATINLPNSADKEYYQKRSKNLMGDLVRVVGAPDLLHPSVEITNRKAEIVLLEMNRILMDVPDIPETSKDAFFPLDLFFHSEAVIFQETIDTIVADIALLLEAARGTIPATPEMRELLSDVSQQKVPLVWQRQSYPSCVPLTRWTTLFRERAEFLVQYMSEKEKVAIFNMGVFHRPDRFIQCVLQTHARKQFKDLHNTRLDAQFLTGQSIPEAPPKTGVYVNGLWINNAMWDFSQSALKDVDAGQLERFNYMPTIWLKPMTDKEFDKSRAEVTHELYDCPIYFSPGSRCLRTNNVIASLSLPTTRKPSLWAEKRVYLTCSLKKLNA